MSTIKHKKVSAVVDGPNNALIQPSNWNDDHVISPAVNGILYDANGDGNIQALQVTGLLQDKLGNGDISGVRVKGLLYDPNSTGDIVGYTGAGLLQDKTGNGTITPVRVRGILSDPNGDGNFVGIAPVGGGVISDPEGDGTYVGVKVTGLWNDNGSGNITGVRVKGLLNDKLGNGVYSGVDVDGVVIGQGENDYFGLAATQPGQVLRRSLYTGGTVYEFAAIQHHVLASDYAFFTSANPKVALTAGVAPTLTFTPIPAGINSASVSAGHRVQIYDITGGVETVIITGVSGNTITTTAPIKNHAANDWSLSTATAGIQEAFNAVDNPYIIVGPGDNWIVGRIKIWSKNLWGVTIAGMSIGNTRLIRNFPSEANGDDMIHYDASLGSGYCMIKDMTIVNSFGQDSLTGLHLTASVAWECNVERVWVKEGRNPIILDHADVKGGHVLRDVAATISQGHANAFSTATSHAIFCRTHNARFINCTGITDIQTADSRWVAGLYIDRSNDIQVIGGFYRGRVSIYIVPIATQPMQNILVDGALIKDSWDYGIIIDGTNKNAICRDITFANCKLAGQHSSNLASAGSGVLISGGGPLDNFTLTGCSIYAFGGNGLYIAGPKSTPKGCIITNNRINNNGLKGPSSGHGLQLSVTGDASNSPYHVGMVISGNQIGNILTNYSAYQISGITTGYGVAPAKCIGLTIVGNDLTGNVTKPMIIDSPTIMEKCIITNNVSVDDMYASLVSAANVSIEAYSWYAVTGPTSIQKIAGGWPGRRVIFIFIDPAPGGFTSGEGQQNGVVRTITIAKNQSVMLTFDGFHWS